MRKISFIFIIILIACNDRIQEKEPKKEIVLKGRTFVFHPEDKTGELTVQFMDSTCHMFEANEYNIPWRLVSFENSNTLVLGSLIISLHRKNDSTIVGLNIGENEKKLTLTEKLPRWEMDEMVGQWTEKVWVGIENLEIPSPPAAKPEHDTIWPPYYGITKNKIISYCLGIDSVNIQIDNSLEYITMKNNLYNYYVGYQNYWRILDVGDSTMTIERKYTKKFFDAYNRNLDSMEVVQFIKKR